MLFVVVACEPPRRPPPIVPMAPGEPCPSATDALGRVRYTCSSHVVLDSVGEPLALDALGARLVAEASAADPKLQAAMRPIELEGAAEALVIDYARPDEHESTGNAIRVTTFSRGSDVLATTPVDGGARLLQCTARDEVAVWEKSGAAAREVACLHTMKRVLRLPPPKGSPQTADCERALRRMGTLPGRPDSLADAEAVRDELRRFATRCTDEVAACSLAATTYVEATLCW